MRRTSYWLIVQRVLSLAALLLAATAIYATVRLAMADAAYRANTPDSLARAVQLEPRNAEYHELLAEHLESENRNEDTDRQAAARLSPLDSRFWIDLGVRAESENHLSEAERLYLRAAAVDRMFIPRWTLMNFYFRRQDSRNFWFWSTRALEMAHDDLSAPFRLLWSMADDGRKIENTLPNNSRMRRQYLFFLLSTKRAQYLSPLDQEVAASSTSADLPSMLDYCERAFVLSSRSAVNVWNTLCRKGLEPFTPLDPEKAPIVSNGDFGITPTERGFDWRVPLVDGVQSRSRIEGSGLQFQLSGDQPENCELLAEPIPLSPGRGYRLHYDYASVDSAKSSGLTWTVTDAATGAAIARTENLKLTGGAQTGELAFNAGASAGARLSLRYLREPGTVRHEEMVILRKIAIEAQP